MIKNRIVECKTINSKIDLYYKNILNKSQRIFTALDRDEHSPTYGSFDRDYWHYKIRDFSSMVLHQASLTLNSLYSWNYKENIFFQKDILKEWIEGSIEHWCKQQLGNGSFNEYYPNEEGYPPTAFSLYATVLLVLDKGCDDKNVLHQIEKSCNWLLIKPEIEASNQEAVGICSVYLASKITGVNVDTERLEGRFSRFFDTQKEEGWFPEYNGPDIGYLSVTIDALWDYYRYSQDERALLSIRNAADFIELFFTDNGNIPVMINSRNTDYVVPYGIFNLARIDENYLSLFYKLLKKMTDPFNFLETTDDRYLCHYVYTSSVRAINVLQHLKDFQQIKVKKFPDKFFKDSGIVIKNTSNCTVYINMKKGGIVYIYNEEGLFYTNHGFRYIDGKVVGVSHWLTEKNEIKIDVGLDEVQIMIKGDFVSRSWLVPTPFKHTVLRLVSFSIGRRIIPILKRIFIFGDKNIKIYYERKLMVSMKKTSIEDNITSNSQKLNMNNIKLSKGYSLRHVSSAARFTPDELLLNDKNSTTISETKKETLVSKVDIQC